MEELPPDPWVALGITKDASENDIKTAYRKGALRCHPDKFPDPAVKRGKEEEFHKISQAHELLTDAEKFKEYKQLLMMHEMRKEVPGRGGDKPSRHPEPAGVYKTRECTPSFATAPPPMPQERYGSYDDDDNYKQRKSSKQHYERPSVRAEKVSSRAATDKKRAEQKKSSDKAKKSDRYDRYERTKLDSSDSDGNAKAQRSYREEDYAPKSWEDKLRDAQDQLRRDSASDRRKAEKSRDARDRDYSRDRDRDRHNVYSTREHVSRAETERPSPQRTSSSRHEVRGEKPATARRSQAVPRDRAHGSYRTTIVEEPEEYDTRKPEFRKPSIPNANSSPAALHIPQDSPRRSYSQQHYTTPYETVPKPGIHRAETMPTVHSNSSRRRDVPSSKIREEDSGYSSPGTPEMPYTTGGYSRSHQPSATMPNVRHVPAEPQYVVREPGTNSYSRYTTSPKGLSSDRERSPKTSSHATYPMPQYQTAVPGEKSTRYVYPDKTSSRPPIPHAASSHTTARVVVDDYTDRERERGRGRDRKMFGEVDSPYHHQEKDIRPSTERKGSYRPSPEDISYSKRYSPADVSQSYQNTKNDDYRRGLEDGARMAAERLAAEMASGGRERHVHERVPRLSRRETAAY